MQMFSDYQLKYGECIYCALNKKESQGPRFLFENEHFICFVPFSQVLDFEICITPKKHYSCLSELNDFEIFTLAETIKNSIARISAAVKPLRYSMCFYLKPKNERDFHFHISINQKTLHSSVEEGYGISVHRVSPEDISKILRSKS